MGEQVKYPAIHVPLTGQGGNAHAITAAVQRALRAQGVSESEIDSYMGESMSNAYDDPMRTATRWVTVS